MSYCEMLTWGGDAQPVEFRNAHGFVALIWDAMQRHLGWGGPYDGPPHQRTWLAQGMVDLKNLQPLWDLAGDPKIDPEERICMALTFDRSYVPAPAVPRVASALRCFEGAHWKRARVCHLGSIASAMEEAVAQGAEFIGFYGMSVSENPWDKYDPATEESRRLAPPETGTSIVAHVPDLFGSATAEVAP